MSENPDIAAPTSSSALRMGDSLMVSLRGVPDPSDNEVQIDDRGMISLPFIGATKASGVSPADLTDYIKNAYQSRDIYREVDVSVVITERYIYVGGEVQQPGRVLWTPDITLVKAVQAAGGFTLYAAEGGVQLTREQETYTVSVTVAMKQPGQDPNLFPGDSINVPRSAF